MPWVPRHCQLLKETPVAAPVRGLVILENSHGPRRILRWIPHSLTPPSQAAFSRPEKDEEAPARPILRTVVNVPPPTAGPTSTYHTILTSSHGLTFSPCSLRGRPFLQPHAGRNFGSWRSRPGGGEIHSCRHGCRRCLHQDGRGERLGADQDGPGWGLAGQL